MQPQVTRIQTPPRRVAGALFVSRAVSKRVFDILAVLALAPVALPLVFIASLFSWITLKPAFYGHKRVGLGGREFRCWKLRTMVTGGDAILKRSLKENPKLAREWVASCKLKDDPRITKSGKFLRKYSIDELPQLWNVLVGDMSLVGPRPVPMQELQRYDRFKGDYMSVRPGITGVWQTSGRNALDYQSRVMLDAKYARDNSFAGDLVICLKTVPALIRTPGV